MHEISFVWHRCRAHCCYLFVYLPSSIAFHERCVRHDADFHVSERAQRIEGWLRLLLSVYACASTFSTEHGGELTKNTTL